MLEVLILKALDSCKICWQIKRETLLIRLRLCCQEAGRLSALGEAVGRLAALPLEVAVCSADTGVRKLSTPSVTAVLEFLLQCQLKSVWFCYDREWNWYKRDEKSIIG